MFSKKVVINSLCEFGPILSFIVAFEFFNFRVATLTMMFAVVLALVVLKRIENQIPLFAILSSLSVLVFGGVSIYIDIPSIFILRDTIFDLMFGIFLLTSLWLKKPALKYLFKNVFAISIKGWHTLTLRWGVFFLILAGTNELIRHNLSPETWVNAKILMIVTSVAFGAYQFTLTKKERLEHASKWGIVK